eukprot:5063025-Alexandrium_andersonii.AAC.1
MADQLNADTPKEPDPLKGMKEREHYLELRKQRAAAAETYVEQAQKALDEARAAAQSRQDEVLVAEKARKYYLGKIKDTGKTDDDKPMEVDPKSDIPGEAQKAATVLQEELNAEKSLNVV